MSDVNELLGKTIKRIDRDGNERLTFVLDDGTRYAMFHSQDCCETVLIEDIAGDLNDLIGSPLTMADEVTSGENPTGVVKEGQDSFTWTFYKFATVKGYVTIRWYGESNGFYSESVTPPPITPICAPAKRTKGQEQWQLTSRKKQSRSSASSLASTRAKSLARRISSTT